MLKPIAFVLLMSLCLAQSNRQPAALPQSGPPQSAGEAAQAAALSAPSPAMDDDLAQMRTDLDRMESLLNNMSSEITFLHDQNLQILLNTNARMWTMLIRDLRQQLAREEQRRAEDKKKAPR